MFLGDLIFLFAARAGNGYLLKAPPPPSRKHPQQKTSAKTTAPTKAPKELEAPKTHSRPPGLELKGSLPPPPPPRDWQNQTASQRYYF